MTQIAPGDVIAVETEAGTRYVQVTHRRPPYATVVRAIDRTGESASTIDIAKGRTAFLAIVELDGVSKDSESRVRRLGHAPIPDAERDYPTFRLAIRDKTGAAVYWWAWDGEGLSVTPPENEKDLPVREVLSLQNLSVRLAKEIG